MRTLIEMAHEVYGEHTFWTEAQLLRLKELERLVRADEREACYTIAKFNQSNHLEHLTADQIKARGENK
jgi:hypothetical protein